MEIIEDYQNKIKTKQNMALLIESIKIMGKYGRIESPFQVEEQYGYQFDIANTLFLNLFAELRTQFINDKFIIELENISISGIYPSLRQVAETHPELCKKTVDLYEKMRESYRYIQDRVGTETINLINLLIENGQAEKVVELFVSEDVPNYLKDHIVRNIVLNYPESLKKIFDIIPRSYCDYGSKDEDKEKFKEMLNQNLTTVLKDVTYIENTIRTMINSKYSDEVARFKVKDIVEFFVGRNLVDINEITWNYQPHAELISSAAVGYITNNVYLGEYLYGQPTYQHLNPTIRTESDKVILYCLLEKRNGMGFEDFIKQENYESTPEKLNYIMNTILEIQIEKPDLFNPTEIDEIINILLKKTKKEDYETMQKVITDLKSNVNINLIEEEREELRNRLKRTCDSLIEQLSEIKPAPVKKIRKMK